MNLYELALHNGKTVMVNLNHIVCVREVAEEEAAFAEVTLATGAVLQVVPQTLIASFDAAEVGYYKFQKQEEQEQQAE